MTFARFVSGRITAWITLAATAVAVFLLFAFVPQATTEEFPQSGLPESAPSRQVAEILENFPSADQTAAIVVFERKGATLTADDRTAIAERATKLGADSVAPPAVAPRFSDDGRAAVVVVPLDSGTAADDLEGTATALRDTARDGLPPGLAAALTGPVGFQADVANAFAGADVRLLLITVIVVAVLLIVTYRSPVLWIVPLAVVGAADALSRVVVGALAEAVGFTVDASIGGILSVLVFGAGTNYALLLVARYREELLHTPDPHEAMRTAVRSAGPAIAASGGTVALSLLTLLLAEFAGNRALGFACSVGVVIAILFALVVLPAALVVCGRGLFWPFIPRVSEGRTRKPSLWNRLGRGVSRHPVTVAVVSTAAVGSLALGLIGAGVGLSQVEQFPGDPESVVAQRVIDTSFSSGLTSETVVLAREGVAREAATVAESVDAVAAVRPVETAHGYTRLSVTLDAEPESEKAFAAINALREAYAATSGELRETLIGGNDAQALDQLRSAERDRTLIIPLILAIVFTILVLLLRSLVAPILLIASVLATFFASIGAGNWLFQHVFGFPAFDSSVILFSFLFLVALGVDYNIFLVTRARESSQRLGTREGVVRALESTGGVITSAGILLAAVFFVLGVLPIVALAQIGTIVCIGVLLDTLVVRTVLVPALIFLVGDAFWWPSRPAQDAAAPSAEKAEAAATASVTGG